MHQSEKKKNSNCLIGKVLASKTLNKMGVSNIANSSWKPEKGLSVSSWKPNVFICNFDSKEDKIRVLEESLWCVMGYLLVLKNIEKDQNIDELDFSTSPFWIQIHSLPFQKRTLQNIEKIAALLGTLVQVEMDSIENPINGLFTD